MKITLRFEQPVLGWLQQLADYGLHGSTVEQVVETLVLKGLRREVRTGGLVQNPPPVAREWPTAEDSEHKT